MLVVVDNIAMISAGHNLQLRFFPESQTANMLGDGNFILTGQLSVLQMQALTPTNDSSTSIDFRSVPVFDRDNKPTPRMAFIFRNSQVAWRQAVAFSWAKDATGLRTVSIQESAQAWRFTVGHQTGQITW